MIISTRKGFSDLSILLVVGAVIIIIGLSVFFGHINDKTGRANAILLGEGSDTTTTTKPCDPIPCNATTCDCEKEICGSIIFSKCCLKAETGCGPSCCGNGTFCANATSGKCCNNDEIYKNGTCIKKCKSNSDCDDYIGCSNDICQPSGECSHYNSCQRTSACNSQPACCNNGDCSSYWNVIPDPIHGTMICVPRISSVCYISDGVYLPGNR